jgi:hypothetical protein
VSNVFVSYRREDSAPYAGRICDRLEAAFGAERVFMDVDDIAPGADFAETIEKRIGACQTLVAVIGPRWLEMLRVRGGEQDFVENEIATALLRGVAVIPALVGGAAMPSERDLPVKLAGLARRQAVTIRDDHFDRDAGDLVRGIRRRPSERSTRKLLSVLIAAGVLIAVVGAALLLARARDRASLNGTWIARMERSGLQPYNIRLRFETSGRTLIGGVEYPTGSGAIEDGTFDGSRLSFFTKHVPQFETEPAIIRFSGEVRGGELHLTAVTPDGALAKGTARKVD